MQQTTGIFSRNFFLWYEFSVSVLSHQVVIMWQKLQHLGKQCCKC